jgi:hypothetical protein
MSRRRGDRRLQRRSTPEGDPRAGAPIEEDGGRREGYGPSSYPGLQDPSSRQRDHKGTLTGAPSRNGVVSMDVM